MKVNFKVITAVVSAVIIIAIVFVYFDGWNLFIKHDSGAVVIPAVTNNPELTGQDRFKNFSETSAMASIKSLNDFGDVFYNSINLAEEKFKEANYSDEYNFEFVKLEKLNFKITSIFSHNNMLYIILDNHEIHIYDDELNFISKVNFPLENKLVIPNDMDVYNDELYVAERFKSEAAEAAVLVFDLMGNFKRKIVYKLPDFGSKRFPEREKVLGQIAVDDGYIYLSAHTTGMAKELCRVYKYDLNGKFITIYGYENMQGILGHTGFDAIGFLWLGGHYEYDTGSGAKSVISQLGREFCIFNDELALYFTLPPISRSEKIKSEDTREGIMSMDYCYYNDRYYFLQSAALGLAAVEVFDNNMNYLKTYELNVHEYSEPKSKLPQGLQLVPVSDVPARDTFRSITISADGIIYIAGDEGLVRGVKR